MNNCSNCQAMWFVLRCVLDLETAVEGFRGGRYCCAHHRYTSPSKLCNAAVIMIIIMQRTAPILVWFVDQCTITLAQISVQLQYFDVKLLKFLFLVKSKYFAFFCVFAIQVLHFPPTLYSHIIQDLKKKLVLVLNKVGNILTW